MIGFGPRAGDVLVQPVEGGGYIVSVMGDNGDAGRFPVAAKVYLAKGARDLSRTVMQALVTEKVTNALT